ncbi:hypothetical protein CROQUDRAFT_670235 [Cronartium quercuum f. sp. fusiforme G11]|uniref:Uncharacterized protein n=1 Tax=Cronartium quercuum f. sp. fusiforme G11 TaxID=708437 RepID=A0A9P6NJ46_9BASI|nr:hypothetical protein CROQUDRAFT_670235 [Cronartium quercuum f. sp. fusiforme G11]
MSNWRIEKLGMKLYAIYTRREPIVHHEGAPQKVPRCQLGPLFHQVISPELTKRDAMNAPAGVPYDAFGSIESIGYHV